MNSARVLAIVVLVAGLFASAPARATPQEDLAFAVGESNHDKQSVWIVERLMTLKVGAKCWPKLTDKKLRALGLIAAYARNVQRYAKVVTEDDWFAIEGQTANSKEANQAVVDKMITEFAKKFHLTITVEGDDCEASGNGLWLKYLSTVTDAIQKFPPKAGKTKITINVKAKTKGVTVTAGKDGSTFTINASRDVEASGWSDKIESALKRVSSKN